MEDYKRLATEALKLHLKIKLDFLKLKEMKSELLKKMSEHKTKKILLDEGQINAFKWKSGFSSLLRKEFKKLDIKKKRELFKTGLLKIHFRLDPKRFQELKNKKEKNELDKYVIDRKNRMFLRFIFNEETLDMLKSKKGEFIETSVEEQDSSYEESLEEIDEEEQEFWDEIAEEVEPDPIYFEDDDEADIPYHQREYLGYD